MYTLRFAVAVAAICTPLAAAQDAAYTAALGALSPATHTGKVTIYTSGSSGATDTLSLVIEVSSTLACTSNNCGAHVHAGTACTDSSTQGAHMLNVDGVTDAWTGKMQFVDTVGTMSTYTVEVPAGNAVITGKPFVVHDATSARVMCGMLGAAPSTTRKYAAVLADIGASGVGAGSVSLYAVGPSSMLLQVELPSSLSCQGNTCGAHVHAGTGCADASAQGGHMLSVDGTDAWTAKMAFVKTMGAISTYYIDVPSGNTAVLDKPFVVHNSAGVRVSCGVLRPRQHSGAAYAPQYNNAYVASLEALASYTDTGAVSIYTRGAAMLSVVIKVSSTLACTSNNCGAHVHSGTTCTDAISQGGHMLNADGATDAWTGKMQFVDTVGTMSTYTVEVPAGNAVITGKPFVVHDATSARVMCGMLGAALSTTKEYAAVLADIGASAVGAGSVSLYAVGPSAMLLQIELPSSLSCQGNTCGAHVHAGTGCADASAQGGHMLNVDGTTDAWTAKMAFVKTEGAISTYYIDVPSGNTAVLDKPFVVHDSTGVRVSCGLLRPRQYSGAAYAPQYNNAYVASLDALASYTGTGSVSIYTRGAMMLSVVIEVPSTLACTNNNCGAHVHAGSACTDATTQGGHMLNSEGADAWTGKMQFVDTVGTKSTYTIDVATGGNANVIGKPFVVHDATSARVMCGMLGAAPSTTRKYAAVLTDIGASGVVVGAGSILLYAVGPSTISLQVDLPSSLSCQTNTCSAHVHAGTGCADSTAQGGHMLNVDGTTDAWTAKMTFVKTVGAVSTYYITFANGNTAVLDKPFVVHNSDGVRVSCGVLRSRQYSGALYSLPTAQVKAVPAGVDTDTSEELAVAIVVSVVSTITIASIVVVLALVVSIILLKKGAKRIEHDLEGPSTKPAEMLSLAENPPHNFSNLPGHSATGEQPSPKLIAKVVVAIDGEADALVSSASAIGSPRASDSEAPLGDEEKAALQATMKKHRDRVGHATQMLAKHKAHIDSNSVLAKLRAGSIRGVKASPIGKRRASITTETANPMAMMMQASGKDCKVKMNGAQNM